MNRAAFLVVERNILPILIVLSLLLTGSIIVFAAVNPSQDNVIYGVAGAAQLNISGGIVGNDMFYANGDKVFALVNYSCSGLSVCNASMNLTANFSLIGGSHWIKGEFITKNAANTWALFQANDTVNLPNILGLGTSTITVSPKNITFNMTDGNWTAGPPANYFFNDTLWTTAVLWNMSTPTGCPPAGENVQLPPQIPAVNGTMVNVAFCFTNCTGDDRVQSLNASHSVICGPTFGGSSTNFTQIASTGNFSNFAFVLEIPNKAKINFTTNVSMDTAAKSQALFQFAMKNIMSGGKIGVNDSEWNGTSAGQLSTVNLTGAATLTLYNMSSRLGISAPHMPQIGRTNYGNTTFGPCPTSVCSGTVWDGENLTFGVTGFSEYKLEQGMAVTSVSPSTATFLKNSSLVTSAPARNVNFTFTPKWNDTVTIKNATLYGNFTSGGAWTANASNSTPLINNSVNGINFSVAADRGYLWNIVVYEVLNTSDTNTTNASFFIDTTKPIISVTSPTAGTTYTTSTVTYAYSSSDTGSDVSVCSYKVDAGAATSTGTSYSATSPILSNMDHLIAVSCTDKAGNTETQTISFTIAVSGGTTVTTSPTTGATTPATTTTTMPPVSVPVKADIATIAAGETKAVTIEKPEEHGVKEIEITAANSISSASVEVTRFSDKPASIAENVSGKVYSYLDIAKTNIADNDVSKVKIRFVVSKSWITSNSVSADTIALSRYTTKWDKLPTTKISERTDEIEYQAESPGMSYFAVSGEPAVTTVGGEEGTTVNTWLIIGVIIVLAAGMWYFSTNKKSFPF